MKLLNHADRAPHHAEDHEYSLDAEKWAREVAAAEAARKRAKRRKERTPKNE